MERQLTRENTGGILYVAVVLLSQFDVKLFDVTSPTAPAEQEGVFEARTSECQILACKTGTDIYQWAVGYVQGRRWEKRWGGAHMLLCRLWNELTDPMGMEWSCTSPEDTALLLNCVRLIEDELDMPKAERWNRDVI